MTKKMVPIPSSDRSKYYSCYRSDEGRWSCDCPHYTFRLRGKGACKHIDVAKKMDAMSVEELIANIDWEDPIPLHKVR